MIALAVLAEVFAVVGVVLCAPSLYRWLSRRLRLTVRDGPGDPASIRAAAHSMLYGGEAEDPPPASGTDPFAYDNGVTTGECEP